MVLVGDETKQVRTVFEDLQGNIRVIYDFERTESRLILMAVFTEEDVRRRTPSATTRLRVEVNQATGAGNRATR